MKLALFHIILFAALSHPAVFGQHLDPNATEIWADTSINRSKHQKTQQFFDSLKVKAYQNKWTRELHNIVIAPPRKPIKDTLGTRLSDAEYLPYAGKIIRKIRFVRLDPFGTSITDTTYHNTSWLNNTANTIHVKTRVRVLENNLLFREGDHVDPQTFADNERLLREQSYIEDARFIISDVKGNPGMVDVTVVTKDVWSKAFFVELNDVESGRVEIWDHNILGTGHELQNNVYWDPSQSHLLGYEAFYRNRNILGSFIDNRIYYQNVYDLKSYGISLERRFLTPNTRYAGGLTARHTQTARYIWFSDTSTIREKLNYNYYDLWLGKAFPIRKEINRLNDKRTNFVLSARVYHEKYFERPRVEEKLLYEFHNKTLWLNSFAISSQKFFRSNLIYSFGRTEDIPIGWKANLIVGEEFDEFLNRSYFSLNLAHGNYIDNYGYLYLSTSGGGFVTPSGELQQGVVHFNANYFTNLYILNQFKFRHFANLTYTRGINRFPLERIYINDKSGLTGFSRYDIYGRQKLVLNLESDAFTPFYLYGFRFVFFGFADFAFIGPERASISNVDGYSALGLGVRFRNERLVFPTFQFRFTFYPNVNGMGLGDYLNFSGEKKLNPNNFYIEAPDILPY